MSKRSHEFQPPLTRRRIAIGIDQARFAFLVGLTPGVLSKIERRLREPSPNEQQRIEAALSELEAAQSRVRSLVAVLLSSPPAGKAEGDAA